MSLESAIRENTAALQALTEALSRGTARTTPGQDTPPPPEALAAYKEHVQKAKPPKKAEPALEKAPPSQLNYDTDVKPAVLRLAAKDKATLRAILDGIGVEKGSQVKPEALPAFLAQVQARL